MKHVQDINIVSPVTKMQRGKYLVEMTLAWVVENSDENDESNSPFSQTIELHGAMKSNLNLALKYTNPNIINGVVQDIVWCFFDLK